ncbi:MAG: hypothetical protein AAF270_14660 [Pseudomonadota bacterium]
MPKYSPLILLGLAGFAIYALVVSAPLLLWQLPGGLPFGNLLTAAGLCALPAAALALSRAGSWHHWLAIGALIISALWLPVSIALAGNLSLNFSNSNGVFWLRLTVITVLVGTVSLACSIVARAMQKARR